MVRLLAGAGLLVLASAAPSASSSAAFAQLADQHNASSGCWGYSCKEYLWTSANEMHTAANFLAVAGAGGPGGARAAELVEATFAALGGQVCDCWRDDQTWLILAWLRTAAVTKNASYLLAAEAVFADLVGPWAAWNVSCGGMMWEKGVPYRNAVTNELFLTASMRLHEATGGRAPPVAGLTYLQWAQKEWAWFNATAMYDEILGVFVDGLSQTNCSLAATTGGYWTYNAGVLLDGLALLGAATGEPRLPAFAAQIARAAAAFFSDPLDPAGVMREVGCGRPAGACSGKDGQLFKGMFARHLGYFAALVEGTQPDDAAWARAWLANQTAAIVENARTPAAGRLAVGYLWQGPYTADDAEPWVAQGAALDALLASDMLGGRA